MTDRVIDRITALQLLLATATVVGIGVAGWMLLPRPDPTADQLNRAVVRSLRDNPSVEFVDLHSGFDVEEMTDDGIHPNRVGSTHIAERLAEALAGTGLRGGRDLALMPLGDSITAWSYRDELAEILDDDGWDFEMVGTLDGPADPDAPASAPGEGLAHDGHPGWTTQHILEGNPEEPSRGRLTEWLASTEPDIVLLHAGTNDLFWTDDGADTIAERVGEIVEVATADDPDRLVVIAEIIPFAPELVDIYVSDQ